MPHLIDTHGSSHPIPETPFSAIQRSQNKQGIAKKVALAAVATLSFVGLATTLALAITLAMPALSAAVVVFSIIAIACCILFRKQSTKIAPLPKPIHPTGWEILDKPGKKTSEVGLPSSLQPEKQPTPVTTPLSTPTKTPTQDQDLTKPKTPTTQVAPTDHHLPPISLVPKAQQLLKGWTQLPSCDSVDTTKFEPKTLTTPFKGWAFPNTKTTLVSTQGEITSPIFVTENLLPMLVNAANSMMASGGGGTNKAFTQVVNPQGWINSREGKSQLKTGECTAGKWINSDGTDNDSKPEAPAFFAQLLGAQAHNLNNEPEKCYESATEAYKNCLAKAQEKGSHYIQLPLISSSLYAPSLKLPNGSIIRKQWIDSVKSALVTAAQHFAAKNPNYPLIIVVTDIATSPLD
ncbi:macro domain-containing protein [Chlamydia sp. 12-01]|uniref:macro domain-containing protein n=1 Tax=Chlamydia sp. 12-01 TaxID=3002742 RepID=UPI0035D456C8